MVISTLLKCDKSSKFYILYPVLVMFNPNILGKSSSTTCIHVELSVSCYKLLRTCNPVDLLSSTVNCLILIQLCFFHNPALVIILNINTPIYIYIYVYMLLIDHIKANCIRIDFLKDIMGAAILLCLHGNSRDGATYFSLKLDSDPTNSRGS